MTQNEYLALVKALIQHDHFYYDIFTPSISDHEYDQKMRELIEYEKAHPDKIDPNSPSQKISEAPTSGFTQKAHMLPMLSLANTYSEEEIKEFINRVKKLLKREQVSFCCELKVDGTAISLYYKNGMLVHALTRGNGKIGDDVTANVKMIRSVPLQLNETNPPESIEIRGEIFLSLDNFNMLNEKREEAGLEIFANPRNAAAGSLKLLDSSLSATRNLNLICFGVAEGQSPVSTQIELHTRLRDWGLPVGLPGTIVVCESLPEIMEFIQKMNKERKNLSFQIDGVVIKVNELKLHTVLGSTGKIPRFAIAYKFAPEQAVTRVLDIVVQVSRSGICTPVAELEPALLSGSMISRATLHNAEEIQRKDIRIGDFVTIEKGGDVIPKIVAVDLGKRSEKNIPWRMPEYCPSCNTPVVSLKGEMAVRCLNPCCLEQRIRQIMYFASKQAMNIDHLGEKTVRQLVEKGVIHRLADIYCLDKTMLEQLYGFKEKSIDNLLLSIEASKKCTLARFLIALGIKYVGSETAELLAEVAGNLDTLLAMKEEDFPVLDGIGEKTAHSVSEFLHNEEHLNDIRLLLARGVHIEEMKKKVEGHLFFGKNFVLTGTLTKYSRAQAIAIIKERGGRVSSSVTKQTNYVLVGVDPGSKYEKGKSLGVQILSEEEFEQMI